MVQQPRPRVAPAQHGESVGRQRCSSHDFQEQLLPDTLEAPVLVPGYEIIPSRSEAEDNGYRCTSAKVALGGRRRDVATYQENNISQSVSDCICTSVMILSRVSG